MKQAAIRRYQPTEKTNPYLAAAWTLLLAGLLIGGALLAMDRLWGSWAPALPEVFAAALLSAFCGAVSGLAARRIPAVRYAGLLPLPVVLVLTGFRGYLAGGRAWINAMLARWNEIHEGGLALFAGDGSERDCMAFALLAAVCIGILAWRIAASRKMSVCTAYCTFWLLLSLFGEAFLPLACVLLLIGQIGMRISGSAENVMRRGVQWSIVLAVLLCVCAVGWPDANMVSIDNFRENLIQNVHDIRYGADTLPQGDLAQAELLHASEEPMLNVKTGQQKALYLRGYVGGRYENGVWEPLPDAAFGGDNVGMLEWLSAQGFDPLTQSAQYYALCDDESTPESNPLEVTDSGASRDSVYAPASLTALAAKSMQADKDSGIRSRGLFGQRSYTMEEVSGTRPAELTVAESWVSDPQTEEQSAYAQAESVYRGFVYDNYVAVSEELQPLLDRVFWEDYDTENDGIYSALTRIREVLKTRVTYTDTVPAAPEDTDPIGYFLTESREGNAVLYASTAVQALRAHGIPARYAEGYYLPVSKTETSADGTVELTGQDAHAWAEVYFDGVGWLPVDVTPGFYFDAVALQQMVGLPDTVRKTAAIDENSAGADQVLEPSGSGAGRRETAVKVIRNVTAFGFGIVGVLLLLATLLLCAMELTCAVLLWNERRCRRKWSAEKRIRHTQKQMFALLSMWGIEASLGWDTDETDRRVAERLPSIAPGEYRRICGLLEKTVYGGIPLEPYEERALNQFVYLLSGCEVKKSWKMRLKLRYFRLFTARA